MASDRSAHDKEMASRMKKNPSRFPDCAVRPWNGAGSEYRKMHVPPAKAPESTYNRGMLGGVLCARLGLGSYGVPSELLDWKG